ncbi:alanine racemase [Nocardia sp. NPDC050175]|uniref:alanine racemase n=1 Tax=Nocardia sp. NPDC050175 TaxID=3364317 RepID=UPI0037961671
MTRLILGPDEATLQRINLAAAQKDTPFYLYDMEVFSARVEALRVALPGCDLYYSAKSNPHPSMARTAAAMGCGLELASLGELKATVAAGVEPARAVLVGPAKSERLLAAAIEHGVTIVVESENELLRIIRLGAGRTHPVQVMLRLNITGARGGLRMSDHQFGMSRSQVLTCLELLSVAGELTFTGYHGYLASQLLSAADVIHNAKLVVDAVTELRELGFPAANIDLGGGFGIGYVQSDGELDLDLLRTAIPHLQSTAGGAKLMFESGRFLAGPAGALVCRVIDIKTIDNRRFVLLDGGMNASGLFGGGNGMRNLCHSVVRNAAVLTGGTPTNICGPLCTPMDRLATNVPCAAAINDLVVWWNMGAYGLSAAPVDFLSFPRPIEVFHDQLNQRS